MATTNIYLLTIRNATDSTLTCGIPGLPALAPGSMHSIRWRAASAAEAFGAIAAVYSVMWTRLVLVHEQVEVAGLGGSR